MTQPAIPPLPGAFKELMHAQFPDASSLLRAIEQEPPYVGLRINTAKQRELPWETSPVPWEKNGRLLMQGIRPGLDPLHAAGAYYMQEPSAMSAVPALDVRPGMRVLDLCAAPGGKSGQIADALGGEGLLLANEIESRRSQVLAQNLERLGVRCALVCNESPERLAARFPAYFDRILVDAPCSGEGMFRRDPATRNAWTSAAPAACARRQRAILRTAAEMLRPGGKLVYSTCTFNRQENEHVVESFLSEHPQYRLEHSHRIFPHLEPGEGHFVACLVHTGAEDASRPLPPLPGDEALRPAWRSFAEANLRQYEDVPLLRLGEWLCTPPPLCPAVNGLRVVRLGVQLARIALHRLEPAHALAMAICPRQARRQLSLTHEQAMAYLHGQSIPAPNTPAGWTLALYEGLALGWGKVSDGQLKNRLPKGLRLL